MDWVFTRHSLARALDMAVGPDELRDVLLTPKVAWTTNKYPDFQMRTNYRIVLAVHPDTRAVITVLWYVLEADRQAGKFDRSLEQDMARIRNH